MKADLVIKNAKIFTADRDNPFASCLALKDGRFVYVGDESGISGYEGEVRDLDGRFIMPGIIDSHVHVTLGVAFEYMDMGVHIECKGKKEALRKMAETIRTDPGLKTYRFMLERKSLLGDDITKEDLDGICPDGEIFILEEECHSAWVNSKLLERFHITDDTPDIAPGLSYYVRKDGHVTGNMYESTIMKFLFAETEGLTADNIHDALVRWVDFCEKNGVSAVFDAGIPDCNEFHERVYKELRDMDRKGQLPIYIEGCYVCMQPGQIKEAVAELKRLNLEYNTEHLKVRTLKMFMDGTLKIETAALVTPYEDTKKTGVTSLNKYEIAGVLKELNREGFDLHLHTVGEAASRCVLDGVELAREELKDDYNVKVTCAHLEIQDDGDIERFAKLGVYANYTPWWHAGNIGGDPHKTWVELLGEERADKMYRCKTLWDSGATVTWSSDEIYYEDFENWNPYLGMEVGMTRNITEKTKAHEWHRTITPFPSEREGMSVEEMILGYTINGAKQLGIEARKGSIGVGKDADFLVFDNDLLKAEHEGFSYNQPKEVYFSGKKI